MIRRIPRLSRAVLLFLLLRYYANLTKASVLFAQSARFEIPRGHVVKIQSPDHAAKRSRLYFDVFPLTCFESYFRTAISPFVSLGRLLTKLEFILPETVRSFGKKTLVTYLKHK